MISLSFALFHLIYLEQLLSQMLITEQLGMYVDKAENFWTNFLPFLSPLRANIKSKIMYGMSTFLETRFPHSVHDVYRKWPQFTLSEAIFGSVTLY